MSQLGNPSAGGPPVASGGAGGNHRSLRQIAGDFAHRPLAMAGLIVLALALLDTLVPPLLSNIETYRHYGPVAGSERLASAGHRRPGKRRAGATAVRRA